jgi:hypothetical protein
MKPSTPNTLEFDSLLDELILDQLSIEKITQLEQIITSDERAFDHYRRSVSLHAMLTALSTRVPATYLSSTQSIDAASPSPHLVSLAKESLWMRSRTTATMLLFALAVSLIVATYVAGLAGLVIWDRIHRTATHDQFASDRFSGSAVATISNATDVQWPQNATAKSATSPIFSGEPLKIDSGTMEIELQAGTKLVVEGPADWSVDGHNSVSLRAGKLVARVPLDAIGFTVETPTAKVVDLGTEFAVAVNKAGTTDVQVLKGKVKLHPGTKRNISSQTDQPIILSAGDARRVERDGHENVAVREVTLESIADRDSTVSRDTPKQIKVNGAFASSEQKSLDISANFLIGGHGLTNGRHSAACQRTMWHSDFGRINNEFVLFELPALHRLDSIKVWNWNQSTLLWIGVKQADIYVSTSGKGDPLSKPAEWKLVVADQQFTPGIGTDNYDTPTIIPLNNVEARFVGIVIDEALGQDPRGPEAKHDCVGLSEVHFFGSRVGQKQTKVQK